MSNRRFALINRTAAASGYLTETDSDALYLRLDSTNSASATGAMDLTGLTSLDVTGVTISGLSSDDLSDVASIGMLDENETVTGAWDFSAMGDITFKTGALGGTLRTGTSAADKFVLQAYDVDGATYVTLMEADAGNTVRLQFPVQYLEFEDGADPTKIAKFDLSNISTLTTRTITFPNYDLTLLSGAQAETVTGAWNFSAGLDILGGTALRAYDTTNTDYISIYDTGSISYLASNTNPIYISSGAGGVYFYNGAGTEVRIYEAAGSDYLSILHNGTTVQYSGAGIAAHQYNQRLDVIGGGLQVHSGLVLSIFDTTNVYSGTIYHDGNELFNNVSDATHDWVVAKNGTRYISHVGTSRLDTYLGTDLRIYDGTNTGYANFEHDGTNFITSFSGTTYWDIKDTIRIWSNADDSPLQIRSQYAGAGWNYISLQNSAGTRYAYFGMNPSDNFVFDNERGGVFQFADAAQVLNGNTLRAYDATNTNYIQMYYSAGEGYVYTNTGNIVLYTGHAYAYKFGSNALISAYGGDGLSRIYMQHDTSSGYLQSTVGSLYLAPQSSSYVVGVLSGSPLRVLDSTNGDYGQWQHDGTDLTLSFSNTTEYNINTVPLHLASGKLYITEQASEAGPGAGRGGIWVLNNAPNELWFTDDTGNDHHVAGGSLSEVFSVPKTSDETVTESTTLQNDDELVFPLQANATYWVKCYIKTQESGIIHSTGFKFTFTVPTGTTGYMKYTKWDGTGDTTPEQKFTTDWTTTHTWTSISTLATWIEVEGLLTTAGTSGNIQLQWACGTTSGGVPDDDTTVLTGSILTVIRAD